MSEFLVPDGDPVWVSLSSALTFQLEGEVVRLNDVVYRIEQRRGEDVLLQPLAVQHEREPAPLLIVPGVRSRPSPLAG